MFFSSAKSIASFSLFQYYFDLSLLYRLGTKLLISEITDITEVKKMINKDILIFNNILLALVI